MSKKKDFTQNILIFNYQKSPNGYLNYAFYNQEIICSLIKLQLKIIILTNPK